MIEIGEKIDNRYRVTGRIAHGGMADVYEAFDVVLHKTVALKIMREDMMDNPKNGLPTLPTVSATTAAPPSSMVGWIACPHLLP